MQTKTVPFQDFLYSQSPYITPSDEFARAYGGGESSYNPLLDYNLETGKNVSSDDPGFKAWVSQKLLNGGTPEQYIASLNEKIGLGPDNITGNDRGGYGYDPATGQVTVRSFDDEFDFGNVILAAGAAGIGYLSGGFGLGELMSSFGGTGIESGAFEDIAGNLYNAGAEAGTGAESLIGDAAADTLGSGPATAATGADGAASSMAENMIDADSIMAPTGSGAGAAETTVAEQMFGEGAKAAVGAANGGGGGLMNSVLDWAQKNPRLAAGVIQTAGGALAGLGKAATEKEIAERNIQAAKDLVQLRSDQQLEQSRAGTLANPLTVRPTSAGPAVLYRSDGTPVYVPGTGLLNSTPR